MRTPFTALILLTALPVFGQQPQVDNARVTTKAFAGSLDATLRSLGQGPLWAAWAEPSRPGQQGNMCDWRSNPTQMHLEGFTHLLMLVRIENGVVGKLKVSSTDCKLDAGGLPFFHIQNVPASESIAWLKTRLSEPDPAILAIALHQGPASDAALDDLSSPAQPEKVRSKTSFWLGNMGGRHGVEVLRRMIANDPSDHVRREVTFGLSQSKEPEALALLIDAAKNDRSTDVRSQAIFWLSQKAGNKQAAEVIGNAVDDPNRQVKEKAVFALSQLPDHEGVPRLIELARTHRDPGSAQESRVLAGTIERSPRGGLLRTGIKVEDCGQPLPSCLPAPCALRRPLPNASCRALRRMP